MAIITWIVKNKKYFFALSITSLLASCTIAQKPFEIKGSATAYAEILYTRQNWATQQVMALLEEEVTLAEEERLSTAELQMYDACQLLNKAASSEMAGEKISLNFQRQVISSLNACDNSVKIMESILQEMD